MNIKKSSSKENENLGYAYCYRVSSFQHVYIWTATTSDGNMNTGALRCFYSSVSKNLHIDMYSCHTHNFWNMHWWITERVNNIQAVWKSNQSFHQVFIHYENSVLVDLPIDLHTQHKEKLLQSLFHITSCGNFFWSKSGFVVTSGIDTLTIFWFERLETFSASAWLNLSINY